MTRVGAWMRRSAASALLRGGPHRGPVVVDHPGCCAWLRPRLDVAIDLLRRVSRAGVVMQSYVADLGVTLTKFVALVQHHRPHETSLFQVPSPAHERAASTRRRVPEGHPLPGMIFINRLLRGA